MPLQICQDPTPLEALEDTNVDFLIFYSSRGASGRLWCPDCVAVESLVQKTFGSQNSPSAQIVYVGQIAQWKTPKNRFRAEPWKIYSVPTIVKIKDGSRLVDAAINQDNLAEFIQ